MGEPLHRRRENKYLRFIYRKSLRRQTSFNRVSSIVSSHAQLKKLTDVSTQLSQSVRSSPPKHIYKLVKGSTRRPNREKGDVRINQDSSRTPVQWTGSEGGFWSYRTRIFENGWTPLSGPTGQTDDVTPSLVTRIVRRVV